MDPVLIHAQVQMWSAKAGMSKSRTAFIETVVGKREVKLLLYFITGRIKALQLKNNIKSVVLKTYDEDQNYLHLTFKNNDFLFVEKLTSTDARQLKRFLDRVYERNLRASRRRDTGRADRPSISTQELGDSLPLKVHSKAINKCFKSGEERGAPGLCELPLFSSSSTLDNGGLLENQLVKRKRCSLDSENNEKENVLEESSKAIEANSVVSVYNDRGKGRDFREAGQSKPGLGFASETDYPEEADLDVCDLYGLIRKLFSPFLLRLHCLEKGMEWHERMKKLLLYPEKSWQGLPNVGNTCYINVVLQSLCSVPLFVNDLFNQGFPWIKPPRDDFNMPLMQLIVLKDIYSMKTREKLLVNITKALPQFGEVFTADRQSDAHEFLSLCLVQLKETVQKLTILWQSENESGGNNLVTQIFADHAITNKIPVCPVANNFEFELLRSIFCKGCGLAVLRKEPSCYLSINIPQGLKGHNLSIQSSFDLFFKAEELEHRCERCMHDTSIALHKFSRLPRVIIIHLKRYSFNESWVMKKDEQNIIISKFLKLSCHCNKNTKPPQPLSENEHVKDLDLLKPLHELGSEIFKSSFNSVTTSQFKDFPTVNSRSTKASEPRNVKRDSKVLHGKAQQEDQAKGATANVIESHLTNETARKFTKLDSGSICQGIRDNDLKITERPPKYQQARKCYKERRDKQTFQEAVTQSHRPRSLEQTENLRKPAQSHTQNGSLNPQGSLGSSKKPGHKDILDKTKPTGKVEIQRATGNERNGYRLFNIISHIGSSLHGGHYINDTFDFRKRLWFTYSDSLVSGTQEDFVLKARLSTGYVFFYMQNEIFEELLARETQSRNTSQ
ncbi:ubiquitin carboxyl-terminal hydrolase 26 [Onychomys torridus]|uniref:ubiquitin carboxyl-terminal hydrolase 26 n=1 Tax=Onychomys torridus TaxID=38674 RepID=UPI00167F87BE|nr:ubiquitin carboxyl-terminal hydrolase 26 [Onychomys torridus]